MSEAPWLTIIGLGEDGLKGLADASRSALETAEIVMGPERHLSLLENVSCDTRVWPVPFSRGIDELKTLRGKKVIVLASGDPFWFGAGATLARHFDAHEWQSHPAPSTFSRVANHLGWPLHTTHCEGLHAKPLAQIRPKLARNTRLIILVRDGAAVAELAEYFSAEGFPETKMTVFEALGGPRERITEARANDLPELTFQHPVCIACDVQGRGRALPVTTGRPDDWFDSDGQITKRPVRAMTLSALAPVPFEHLWDIGGGSGSIGIEWLLSHPTLTATTFEARADRAARITSNAAKLGVGHLHVITGTAPAALEGLEPPDAVFIGGGLSDELLQWIMKNLTAGTRLVANAVTLETEALLLHAQAKLGGDLMRLELSRSEPLGARRGWNASYPIVQWSVTL